MFKAKLVRHNSLSFLALVVGLIALLAAPVLAEDVKEGSKEGNAIYVVDVQRAVNESVMGKAARQTLETDIKKEGARLDQMKGDIVALQKDYENQSSVLSGSALSEKRDSLAKKERDLQLAYQDRKNELEKKNALAVGKVVTAIDKIIKQLSKENNYQFVFETDPTFVVYARKSLDLTDDIIKHLDDDSTDS